MGVHFIHQQDGITDAALALCQHRYCQALMRARHGEHVSLDAMGINCPAAAAAFGFRLLPENLQNGKGLVGFGIVADESIGQTMFARMPKLDFGAIQAIELFPLDRSPVMPEVVVISFSPADLSGELKSRYSI